MVIQYSLKQSPQYYSSLTYYGIFSLSIPCYGHLRRGACVNVHCCYETVINTTSVHVCGLGVLLVVAVGVALGVFVGGILLTIAALFMKRFACLSLQCQWQFEIECSGKK